MISEENEADLLDKAEAEEKAYNWVEAANLYEPIIKFYLDSGLIRKAAKTHKKLGYAIEEAAFTVDTAEKFTEFHNMAIYAYKKAMNLFNKTGNQPEELECKALALNISGLIADSLVESKKRLTESQELMMKANELYSDEGDQESIVRTLNSAAYMLTWMIHCSIDHVEANQISQKCTDLAKKSWKLSKKLGNIQFLADSLESEFSMLTQAAGFFMNVRKNESLKRNLWDIFSRYEGSLTLFEDCGDLKAQSKFYYTAGGCYFFVGFHLITDEYEQSEYFNKALELLEKGLFFSRKIKNKLLIMASIFWLDFGALLGRKIEFLQSRITKDIEEINYTVKVFAGVGIYNVTYATANLLPGMYYSNIAQMNYFTPAQRKFYAIKGIEHATICFNNFSSINSYEPFFIWSLMNLTFSYSTLVNLTPEIAERNEYVQKMLQYANETSKISETHEEGFAKSTGYMCLYRAYKTLADIAESEESRINMLSKAIDAQEKYIPHSLESLSGNITARMRLGLLYEELGILSKETNPIIQAKETFHEIVKECFERGYIFYAASAHEYLARVEDRLGNHTASAENYEKAQEMHKISLISIEYKRLKNRVNEKIGYTQAWNLIEQAKMYHKREDHLKAKECYNKASDILEKLRRYHYESSYYNAWALLEEAEQLSKEEKQDNARKKYDETKTRFENAIVLLKNTLKQSKEKFEKEHIEKLKKVANLRINYCTARINLENARILGRKGQHIEAAEKFVLAASQFRNVCTVFKIERERKEIEAIYYLCRAWECMELAEQYEDPERFSDAANLFLKASNLFAEKKLKLLAEGNSTFCQALKFGIKFDESINTQIKTQLYQKIKVMLRKAASIYDKGGYESGADWALATSTYFDATWNLIRADETLELEEREKYLGIGARYLSSAAELFNKAGYKDKEEEIRKKINRLEKEEKILFSALNTIEQPSISKSTIGIIAPTCPIEIAHTTKLSEIQEISEESRRIKKKKLEDSPKLYECDTSLNILHLSDIQEGRFGIKEDISTGNEVYYNYLSDLESKLEILHRKDKIDFVVISGDLASTGSKEEYDNLTMDYSSRKS